VVVFDRYLSTTPYLVFDVGGTSIRAGAYDPERDALAGRVHAFTTSNWSSPSTSPDRLLARLIDDLRVTGAQLLDDPAVVSVGFPGPVDAGGDLLAAPTVLGRCSGTVALGRLLGEAWPGARVVVTNDVTAAGYALARGDRDSFCVVTVGSGIGCKVFLDGRPVLGAAGRGGEIGHLRVDASEDANPCECGGRGHLSAVGSGRGAVLSARRRTGRVSADLTGEALVAAFHAGESFACEVVGEAAAALGSSLAGLHTALGLERFVVTGGFGTALGERYRRLLAQAAARASWDLGQDWDRMIELDRPDGLSGLLGAGRFAKITLAPAVAA
jgi:predicted NBD/HSP70 family sugar kinase